MDKKTASFTERLIATIIDNIQITIRNIHIRYEDYESNPWRPINFGVVLPLLQIYTTDANWQRAFLQQQAAVYKELILTNFFIYFNTERSLCYPCRDKASMMKIFQNIIVPDGTTSTAVSASTITEVVQSKPALVPTRASPDAHQVQYVFTPLNGYVRAIMQKHVDKDDIRTPKYGISSTLHTIGFSLSEAQFNGILQLLATLSALQQQLSDLYAPFDPVRLYRAGTDEEKFKYIDYYKRTLNASWLAELNEVQKHEKEKLEEQLSFEDLATWRQYAMNELKRELDGKAITLSGAEKKGFFSRLFGGKKNKEQEHYEITDADRDELFQQLEYDPNRDDAVLEFNPASIIASAELEIKEFSLSLKSKSDDLLFKLGMYNVSSLIHQRLKGLLVHVVYHTALSLSCIGVICALHIRFVLTDHDHHSQVSTVACCDIEGCYVGLQRFVHGWQRLP